jgi:hypothetical protein
MRRAFLFLVAATACGGRATTPSAPTPAAAPAVAAAPAALGYAAGTARYRVESQTHTVQEVMGNTQTIDASVALLVQAVSSLEGGHLATTFTVDSASGSGMQAEGVSVVRGMTFRTTHSPAGRPMTLVTPDSTNPVVVQIGQLFRGFYPRLPESAPSAGFTWSETSTDSSSPASGMNLRTQATRDHRVVGWEEQGGTRALRVATTGRYTVSGEGEQGGQALTITGSGQVTVESLISAAGALLSQTSNDSTTLSVTVVSMGLEVPIRQSRRATLTKLP